MSAVLELLASELDDHQIQKIADHIGADRHQTQAAIEAALPTLVAAMSRTSESNEGAAMLAMQMHQFGGGSLGDLLGSVLGRSRPSSAPNQKPSPDRTSQTHGFDDILPPGFGKESSAPRSDQPTPPAPYSQDRPPQKDPFEKSLGPGNELQPSSQTPFPTDLPRDQSPAQPPLDDMLGNVLGNKQKRVEDAIGKASGLDLRKIGPLLMILAPIVLGAMRVRASTRSSSNQIDPKDLSEMMRGERNSIEQKRGGSLIGRMLDQDGDGDFDLSDMIKIGFRSIFGRR